MNHTTTDKAYQHHNPGPPDRIVAIPPTAKTFTVRPPSPTPDRLRQYAAPYGRGGKSPSTAASIGALYAGGAAAAIFGSQRRENAGHTPKKDRNRKPRRSRSR